MDDDLTQAIKKKRATTPPDPDPIINGFRRLGVRDHLIAKLLGVTPGRVSQWNSEGRIPEGKRQRARTKLRQAWEVGNREAEDLARNHPAVIHDPGFIRYRASLDFVAGVLGENKE